MTQDWIDDSYNGGLAGPTSLQYFEDNFLSIKTLFAGTTAPGWSSAAGMPWLDTTQKVLKMRNAGNSAWIGLMHGDVSQKMWIYRNTAMDGWAIDGGVSDRVLAMKGGSTYTTGGADVGSWSLSGITVDAHTHAGAAGEHTHGPGSYDIRSSGAIGSKDPAGTNIMVGTSDRLVVTGAGGSTIPYAESTVKGTSASGGSADTGEASSTSITSDSTWRVSASVGTLQYLDL